jgi:hypothetical protein
MEDIFDEIVLGTKDNIFRYGYGRIAQIVMRDINLPPLSKSIYAYLCSFAGEKRMAFPGVNLMAHELGLNKNTITKYLKPLKQAGYIVVKPKKEQGKFRGNIYYIIIESDAIKSLNVKKNNPESKVITSPISQDTVKPKMKKSDTAKSGMVRTDNKNNNSTIINNKNKTERKVTICVNQILNSQSPKKAYAQFVFLTPEEYQDLIEVYGENAMKKVIDKLNNFKGSKQNDPKYQYSSDYFAMKSWVIDALSIKPLSTLDKIVIENEKRDKAAKEVGEEVNNYLKRLSHEDYLQLAQQAKDILEVDPNFKNSKLDYLQKMLIKAKITELVKTRLIKT